MPGRRARSCAVTLAAAVLACSPVRAFTDVVDKGAGGFTLKTTVTVAAPPDRVFRALVDVGAWWSSDHTYSGDARNMSIAPVPGGCFCEKLPGGGVEHGRVLQVKPDALLRLDAALGPLQEMGVSGSMTWQVASAGGGSTVTMTYAVGGYAPGGLDAIAPLVDEVLSQQVQRLKAYAEQAR